MLQRHTPSLTYRVATVWYGIVAGDSAQGTLQEAQAYSIDEMKRVTRLMSLTNEGYVSAYDWRGRLVERWQAGECIISEG